MRNEENENPPKEKAVQPPEEPPKDKEHEDEQRYEKQEESQNGFNAFMVNL